MEKNRAYKGTPQKSVSTTCPFCGCGCNIAFEVKDDQIVRARPGKDITVSNGALCVKGSYGYDFVHSQERLTSPLLRTEDGFVEVTWEQALDKVAAELNRIKKDSGNDSLALLGSPKCTNEENYLFQKLARTVMGTNNIDNGSRLCSAAGIAGIGSAVGFPGTTNSIDALEKSDAIVVIGADLSSSAPIVGYAVKRAVRYTGAKLLLVDPRQTKLASFAYLWLRPRVGTDMALINGMARVIITEGLFNEEYVARKTDNFDVLSQDLTKCTPEYVEEVTGVPAEEMCHAAQVFARANISSIVCGSGITQREYGTDSVAALANLAMLTGNISRRGGIFTMQKDCNGQGACDMGASPDLLPGYGSVNDAKTRSKFEDRWGSELPADAGLTAIEMIHRAREGSVKGMYIMGENPVISFPDAPLVKEALSGLEFLVVQDMFFTETAKMANVVLPAASFAEKEGTFTNFEGRVQPVRKVIAPLGDSLPDWEIIVRLADSMGQKMPYSSLKEVMDEIQEIVPFYRSNGFGEQETKDIYRAETDDSPFRKRRLYKGQFPSGFNRFTPVHYEPQRKAPKNGYNFTLLTGSVLFHSGSGSRSSKSSRLSKFSPGAYVEIGEADAGQLGISQGDAVKVISEAGEVTTVAKFTDMLPDGMVFMPVSFPSTPVNQLFGTTIDSQRKTPALKSCAVRLERIESYG